MTGNYWKKNGQVLNINIVTNNEREDVVNIVKKNLEELGFKIKIKLLNNSYYKNNLDKLNYDVLLTGSTVSIKPEIHNYLEFNIEKKETEKETYKNIYNSFKQNPNFMGLYFDSITVLISKKVKGNFKGNWYDIFYNIDTWYKVKGG